MRGPSARAPLSVSLLCSLCHELTANPQQFDTSTFPAQLCSALRAPRLCSMRDDVLHEDVGSRGVFHIMRASQSQSPPIIGIRDKTVAFNTTARNHSHSKPNN
eukprot:4848138-Amphidinium_carterae.1